jgi:hypothetical protein
LFHKTLNLRISVCNELERFEKVVTGGQPARRATFPEPTDINIAYDNYLANFVTSAVCIGLAHV